MASYSIFSRLHRVTSNNLVFRMLQLKLNTYTKFQFLKNHLKTESCGLGLVYETTGIASWSPSQIRVCLSLSPSLGLVYETKVQYI